MIPKPEMAKEIEKKREESQSNVNQALLKRFAFNSPQTQNQKQRRSTLRGDNFTQVLLSTNINAKKSFRMQSNQSNSEIEDEEKRLITDQNLTFEQILDMNYKGWNQIKLFGNGEAFGEIALLTKQRRTGTMICKEDTHIMSLSKEAFDKIMGKYHEKVKQDKIGFLRQFQVFDGVPVSKLMSVRFYFIRVALINEINVFNYEQLILDMKTKTYQINNILYEEGDKVEDIFFIKNGEIELSKLTHFQIQKDTVLQPDSKYAEKFIMYNLKHSRQIQKEQKKRVRISLLTNGQCFGDYEIKLEEPFRSQKAVISRENTEVYSLHKSLLLDMLKTHKITDNIVKQNDINTKFHEAREKEIIEQSIKNHQETEKLMKKHIKKKLKHAMKLPDLSLLTEEEQKILFEQFPYLKTQQQRNQQLLLNSIERISGSSQQNRSEKYSFHNNDNSKDNDETAYYESSGESNSFQNSKMLVNGHIDIDKYQEFTSKFLKKPIGMKLFLDTQNKRMMLSFLKQKQIQNYQKSQNRSRDHISSNLDQMSLHLKSASDDSGSDDEFEESQSKKFTKQRLSLLRDDINEDPKQKLLYSSSLQNSFYGSNKQGSSTNSPKSIFHKKKRNSLSFHDNMCSDFNVQKQLSAIPQYKQKKRLEMEKEKLHVIVKQNQYSSSLGKKYPHLNNIEQGLKNEQTEQQQQQLQSMSDSNKEETCQNRIENSNEHSQNSMKLIRQNSNIEVLNKFNKSKENNRSQLQSQGGQGESSVFSDSKHQQSNENENDQNNFKSLQTKNSVQEDYGDGKNLSPSILKQFALFPSIPHQPLQNIPENSRISTSQKSNRKFFRNESPEKQKEIQPRFWIEDNNLLSKEEKRRKVSYAIYQSKQFLSQSKLNLNKITVYVGNEEITHTLTSANNLSKQESHSKEHKDKSEKCQTETAPFKSSNHQNQAINYEQDQQSKSIERQNENKPIIESNFSNDFVKNNKSPTIKQPLPVNHNEKQIYGNQQNDIDRQRFSSQKKNPVEMLEQINEMENLFIPENYGKSNITMKDDVQIKMKDSIRNGKLLQKNMTCSDLLQGNKKYCEQQDSDNSPPLNSLTQDYPNLLHKSPCLELNESKNTNHTQGYFPTYGKEYTTNLIFSCDVSQDVRLISDVNNNSHQINKVEKILDSYFGLKKRNSINSHNISSTFLTSKQKREMTLANNYHFPQASSQLNTTKTQNQTQNNSSLQNSQIFSQAASNILSKPQNLVNQNIFYKPSNIAQKHRQTKSLQNNASLPLNNIFYAAPSQRVSTIPPNEGQQASPKLSNNLTTNNISKSSRQQRNSFNLFLTTANIPVKQGESPVLLQAQSQFLKRKQSEDIHSNKTSAIGITDQKVNNPQIALSTNTVKGIDTSQNQFRGDNQQYSHFHNSIQNSQSPSFKNGNKSQQILQNFLSNNSSPTFKGSQLNSQTKSSQNMFYNYDQVIDYNDSNKSGMKSNPLTIRQKNMSNAGIKSSIGNISTIQSEVVSPRVDDNQMSIFRNNQATLPAFPKILPTQSYNITGRENSRDLKAQQLLLKRNLI